MNLNDVVAIDAGRITQLTELEKNKKKTVDAERGYCRILHSYLKGILFLFLLCPLFLIVPPCRRVAQPV